MSDEFGEFDDPVIVLQWRGRTRLALDHRPCGGALMGKCSTRTRYPTKLDADIALADDAGKRRYYCPRCCGWHLVSTSASRDKRARMNPATMIGVRAGDLLALVEALPETEFLTLPPQYRDAVETLFAAAAGGGE